MSSTTLSAQTVTSEDLMPPQPAIHDSEPPTEAETEFSFEQIHALAQEHIAHEECNADLKSTNEALHVCQNDLHPRLEWWQTPQYAVGAPILAVAIYIIFQHRN